MGKDSKLPKCRSNVKGRALIEYQVSALRAIEMSEVIVVTGYKRHLVAPFGDFEVFNDEWRSTIMVYCLPKASSIVDRSGCIVSYVDIFYEESAPQALIDCPNDISILYSDNWKELWKMRSADSLADAKTF